jgi:CRISPR-associated endonuclease/helicase Cas3
VLASLGVDGTDQERIQAARTALNFPEVAERFRMIEEPTETVVVTRYGPPAQRERVRADLARLRSGAANTRLLLRRLQPHTVSLYRHQAQEDRRAGLIADVTDGVGEWLGEYDQTRGIVAERVRLDDLVV